MAPWLFGHFGVEWDLIGTDAQERAELAAWIDLYRRFRWLLHSGRVVRADPDEVVAGAGQPAALVRGVVSHSREERSSPTSSAGLILLHALPVDSSGDPAD